MVLLALGLGPAFADDPRQAGDALSAQLLSEGPKAALAGRLRLAVQVGDSRPVGAAVLQTDVVERDGEQIYRLTDRLNVDLPGLGSARLRVESDVRADFTALRVVLSSEEPRRNAAPSRQRIALERVDGRWVRSVTVGEGAPVVTPLPDLPERLVVLTPPLGAGERLARVAPATLGARYKIPAHDLETSSPTAYKLSVDESVTLTINGQPVEAVQLVRREGPSRLLVWRDSSTGAPLRVARATESPRLLLRHPDLQVATASPGGPVAKVLSLLRAAARAEPEALKAVLDFDALYADANGPAGDSKRRALFEQLLLEHLTDPEWLEARGLLFVASACDAACFEAASADAETATVRPKGAPAEAAFHLSKSGGSWRIVRLPRRGA